MNEEPYVQFKLRLPESMRDRLELAATESGRSLSSEILFRLDATLPRSPTDLRLQALRRTMADAEARYDYRRRLLDDAHRRLKLFEVQFGKEHRDHPFYIDQVRQAEERLDETFQDRVDAINALAAFDASSMDHD